MLKKINIFFIYAYTFLSTFILFYACDTLFYLERGISSSYYILFVLISSFTQIVLEIPSGIIADKCSKKKILLLGNFLFICSILIFINSNNYCLFVLGIIIKSIDNALVTGVSNSILYDYKENNNFNNILFNKNLFYNLSYMIAMILGGYIGQKYGLVYTYYLSLIPLVINFIVILLINDNSSNLSIKKSLNKKILNNAIHEIKNNKIIINSFITSSIMFSIIKLIEESHPEYSSKIGISIFEIGIYTSLILIFCILGNYIGSKVNQKYYNAIIYGNSFFVGFCVLLLGLLNNKYGIIFLLVIYIFSESYDIVMFTTLHNNISSKSRVTIESILSMFAAFCGIIFSGVMSILLNYIQLYQMYIVWGILIIIYSIINYILNIKFVFKNK